MYVFSDLQSYNIRSDWQNKTGWDWREYELNLLNLHIDPISVANH